MYSPADVQKIIYPYLVTIYAFLISALISLVQSNLTRNDAIFVLIAVASPATLLLWTTFLVTAASRLEATFRLKAAFRPAATLCPEAVWRLAVNLNLAGEFCRRSLPWVTTEDSHIQTFLYVSILGSFVMWLTMIGITVIQPSGISFSQKACSTKYGGKAIVALIWPLGFMIQLVLFMFCLISQNHSQVTPLTTMSKVVRKIKWFFGFPKDKTVL